MNKKLRNITEKGREPALYIAFGVLTTLVSVVSFQLACAVMDYLVANVVSWVAAVTFAFMTNRRFVFKSDAQGKAFWAEAMRFYAARLFSLGVEELGLLLLVDIVRTPELVAKLSMQVVVVVLNYVLSKLMVFKAGK